ncbi:MAG: hypothetical protein MHPSP_003313, partial [Paramarteilia canceri]
MEFENEQLVDELIIDKMSIDKYEPSTFIFKPLKNSKVTDLGWDDEDDRKRQHLMQKIASEENIPIKDLKKVINMESSDMEDIEKVNNDLSVISEDPNISEKELSFEWE